MGDTQSRSIINVRVTNFPWVPIVLGSGIANINKTKSCVLQAKPTGKTDCKFFTTAERSTQSGHKSQGKHRGEELRRRWGDRHEISGGGSIRIES